MEARFAVLPGDGVGPEVTAVARDVLAATADRFGHTFDFTEHLAGGVAIDATGDPLPKATLNACEASDAVLLGAVGGPKWDDPHAPVRPEGGLLQLRRALRLFANLRPIKPHPELVDASPLRPEIIAGTDILFVRELTGGIYFGSSGGDAERAYNVMEYTAGEIERVVRIAAAAARDRRGKVTSVDKANVLAVSRLWRAVTTRVMTEEFPDVELEHVLVDAMAMHLLARPRDFDVVVTANLFGDILTDEAAMLTGSLGMLPSAALGGEGPGLYEPVHGSAPDIAGTGTANPLAAILAGAMALRHGLGLEDEANAVEQSVTEALRAGHRTADLGGSSTTADMGTAVVSAATG